jgi:hypothetical protein
MAFFRRKLLRQTSTARRSAPRYPLVYQWSGEEGDAPLPVRAIKPLRPLPKPVQVHAQGVLGLAREPFHITRHIHALCCDIAQKTTQLSHIDMQRVLIGITRARSRRPHGLQAKVTPLRLRHGQLTQKRRGWNYQVQQYYVGEVEMLYVMTFCLPRFLDLGFEEKMITIFHELFHISPDFNGDLRRHDGRYYQHTHSKKKYDCHMKEHVQAYLQSQPDSSLYGFLHHTFEELHERHGQVKGVSVPVPKLVPLIH